MGQKIQDDDCSITLIKFGYKYKESLFMLNNQLKVLEERINKLKKKHNNTLIFDK